MLLKFGIVSNAPRKPGFDDFAKTHSAAVGQAITKLAGHGHGREKEINGKWFKDIKLDH